MFRQNFNLVYFAFAAVAFLSLAWAHGFSIRSAVVLIAPGFLFLFLYLASARELVSRGHSSILFNSANASLATAILRVLAILLPVPAIIYSAIYYSPMLCSISNPQVSSIVHMVVGVEDLVFGVDAGTAYMDRVERHWMSVARACERRGEHEAALNQIQDIVDLEVSTFQEAPYHLYIAMGGLCDRMDKAILASKGSGEYCADSFYFQGEVQMLEKAFPDRYVRGNVSGNKTCVSDLRLLRILKALPEEARKRFRFADQIMKLDSKLVLDCCRGTRMLSLAPRILNYTDTELRGWRQPLRLIVQDIGTLNEFWTYEYDDTKNVIVYQSDLERFLSVDPSRARKEFVFLDDIYKHLSYQKSDSCKCLPGSSLPPTCAHQLIPRHGACISKQEYERLLKVTGVTPRRF